MGIIKLFSKIAVIIGVGLVGLVASVVCLGLWENYRVHNRNISEDTYEKSNLFI